MFRKRFFRDLPLLLLTAALALSGCSLIEPVATSSTAPTPVMSFQQGGVDNPNIFVDPETFQPALLKALVDHDTAKLQMWMTEPVLTGAWRAELSETAPVEALKSLYAEQLGGDTRLALVKSADLKALMGGKDPLSIPRSDSGVMYAFLVSGWGKDGRDEAVLFIARQTDNSLKWHGWIQVQGGFSGAHLGGIQPYANDPFGFHVYLPKNNEITAPNANEVVFLAPGQGHPDENRAAAFLFVEPANGRTAEQVATQLAEKTKAEMGAGYTGGAVTGMSIDGEPAYSVNWLPGQDINRQLFVVHKDLLYKFMFIPDSPQAPAYQQMEDIYAMIVNTLHFTR